MAKFTDASGRDWSVEFDGLLLDKVQQDTGIDIADLSAGGLFRLDQHAPTLVKVLAVLCGDERKERNLSDREFSKAIKGNVLSASLEAIMRAAQIFFPQSTWSELQSRLTQQKDFNRDWSQVQPLVMRLNAPDMPQAMREAIMAAIAEMMGNIGSPELDNALSAGGPAATPPMPVSVSPANAEHIHEDSPSAVSG